MAVDDLVTDEDVTWSQESVIRELHTRIRQLEADLREARRQLNMMAATMNAVVEVPPLVDESPKEAVATGGSASSRTAALSGSASAGAQVDIAASGFVPGPSEVKSPAAPVPETARRHETKNFDDQILSSDALIMHVIGGDEAQQISLIADTMSRLANAAATIAARHRVNPGDTVSGPDGRTHVISRPGRVDWDENGRFVFTPDDNQDT